MVHAPERLAVVGKIAERQPVLTIIVEHMAFARATIDDATIAGADGVRVPPPNSGEVRGAA